MAAHIKLTVFPIFVSTTEENGSSNNFGLGP